MGEAGGMANMYEKKRRGATFSVKEMASELGFPNGHVLCSAGLPVKPDNRSGSFTSSEDLKNKKRVAFHSEVGENGKIETTLYDSDRFGMVGTLFISQGERGDVLKI